VIEKTEPAMQSQIFGAKSNAARAAKRYGIKRDDLIAVSGGWYFELPDEAATQSPTEPATEAIDGAHLVTPTNGATPISEPAVPADEPLEWGGVDYMVVTGVKPIDLGELVGETVAAPAKPKAKRQRKPKVAERRQPAKSPGADKRAATDKPKNQAPKEGKGAAMLADLKERWIPVPELLEFTGWLPHTLRGYISRTAKAEGWTLERDKVDGVTCYRIKV
jgi:Protein of unknown function (DUF3489)